MILIEAYKDEIWKDINNYEGWYQISNHGRVRSLDRYITYKNGRNVLTKGKILKTGVNCKSGRPQVSLQKDGKVRGFYIYRLVAEHFVHNEDPEHNVTVNHIDGDITNNYYKNLEWCSQSENEKHSYDVLHRPVNKPGVHKRVVICWDKDGNKITYPSIAAAERGTGMGGTRIRVLHETGKTSKNGYRFFIPSLSVEDNERVDND